MSNVQYATVKMVVRKAIDNWAQDHDIERLTDEDVLRMIDNCADGCYEMNVTEKQADNFVKWFETSRTSSQIAYFRKYIEQYIRWYNGEC